MIGWGATARNVIVIAPCFIAAGFNNILACVLYLLGLIFGSIFWAGWGARDEEVPEEPPMHGEAQAH